jgi:hypothetical protein
MFIKCDLSYFFGLPCWNAEAIVSIRPQEDAGATASEAIQAAERQSAVRRTHHFCVKKMRKSTIFHGEINIFHGKNHYKW